LESSSVHHQKFFTVHTAMVYVIQVCRPVWHTPLLCLLHVLENSSVHDKEFFTVHTAMVYVIQVCRPVWHIPLLCLLHVSESSSVHDKEFFTLHTAMVYVSKPVWHIPLLCVERKTPDDGQRNCPKRVEFYSKNKFEKLMYLVGFIVRIIEPPKILPQSNVIHSNLKYNAQSLKVVCICTI